MPSSLDSERWVSSLSRSTALNRPSMIVVFSDSGCCVILRAPE